MNSQSLMNNLLRGTLGPKLEVFNEVLGMLGEDPCDLTESVDLLAEGYKLIAEMAQAVMALQAGVASLKAENAALKAENTRLWALVGGKNGVTLSKGGAE